MTIGERIKNKREELGMSQDELAKRCGYKSRSSINKIELKRDLPLNKVSLIADALGVSPSYLMGWEDVEEQRKELGNKIGKITKNIYMQTTIETTELLETLDKISQLDAMQVSELKNFLDYLISKKGDTQ